MARVTFEFKWCRYLLVNRPRTQSQAAPQVEGENTLEKKSLHADCPEGSPSDGTRAMADDPPPGRVDDDATGAAYELKKM